MIQPAESVSVMPDVLQESSLPSPRPHDVTDADAQPDTRAAAERACYRRRSRTVIVDLGAPRDHDDDGAQVADICFAHCS